MFTTASTSAIDGRSFLVIYGALCAAALLAVALTWHRVLGARARDGDDAPADLGLYELAALSDGAALAITSAATQLHHDGHLKSSASRSRALEIDAPLAPDADPIERAVFETVAAEQPITGHELRRQVADSDAVQSMTAALTRAGLLVAPRLASRIAWGTVLLGGLLAILGIARIAAGALNGRPVDYLVIMVAAVVIGTIWLAGSVPTATRRGRAALARWRDAHADLRRNPAGTECALAAALFGVGALWLAAPDIASALGVEREDRPLGGGGSGAGGGCGSGCGGCGGCG